jgi:hypothetical protein
MTFKAPRAVVPALQLRQVAGLCGIWVCWHCTGCGIQGGTEGNGVDTCVYEPVVLNAPDVVAEGFSASPRALFAPAAGTFEGEAAEWNVTLTLQPESSTYQALYDTGGDPACTPRLSGAALITLELASPAVTAGPIAHPASLDFAGTSLLSASMNIEVGADHPLNAVAPAFSGAPLVPPMLHIALGLGDAVISSEWRWSASIACAAGAQCSGGPVPGVSVPTTGDEVDWGSAALTRRP